MVDLANPFRPTRFEHQHKKLLWLSHQTTRLEEPENFYIQGSRGAGKTSILWSLNWEQRLNNPVVISQIKNRSNRFLSVYFRVPDFSVRPMSSADYSRVFECPSDDIDDAYFTLYLEFVTAYLVLDAVEELRAHNALAVADEVIVAVVEDVLKAFPFLSEYEVVADGTVRSLGQAFFLAFNDFRRFALSGDFIDKIRSFPVEREGSVLAEICSIVSRRSNLFSEESSFHLKVCIDECEMLTSQQQRAINTLVRKSKHPIFWIISYVDKGYETTSTRMKGLNLSDADRTVVSLDNEPEFKFKRLCENVSRIRLNALFEEDVGVSDEEDADVNGRFKLEDVLGPTFINDLFHAYYQSSLSKRRHPVQAVQELAQAMNAGDRAIPSLDLEPFDEREASSAEVPPYYQAYIHYKLKIPVAPSANPRDARHHAAYLRRKQRAALVGFFHEAKAGLPYSGWQCVVSLSDNCIRDYLEIMADIFDAHAKGSVKRAKSFASGRVSVEDQKNGIVRASRGKLESIATLSKDYTREAFRLVECLASLVRELQAPRPDGKFLKTAERGVFRIDIEGTPEGGAFRNIEEVERLLENCDSLGYLKMERAHSEEGDLFSLHFESRRRRVLSFRLHRRFAPYFGFSYRGPYETVPLPVEAVQQILANPIDIDPTSWAQRVYQTISPDDRAPELPFEEGQ